MTSLIDRLLDRMAEAGLELTGIMNGEPGPVHRVDQAMQELEAQLEAGDAPAAS